MLKKISLFLILLLSSLTLICSCNSKNENSPISFEVSDIVQNANTYIAENSNNVITEYKNKYHLTAPIGWINDPNGFSEFDDKYHLFYQYNPYDAVWGPMHWGHQTTKDFIKWEYEDVALAPDELYDASGCFSGTAFVENGIQYLAYTAVTDKQNQALAYSYDGVTYKKLENLLIDGSNLPDGFSNYDFRDPKIFKKNNKYYVMCGNKNDTTNDKQIIMFEADNIVGPYEYKGIVYKRKDLGGILECPDYIELDDTSLLIFSPQSIGSEYEYVFQNTDSACYLVGNLSTDTYKFYQSLGTDIEEFDKGFSFYAPQTMKTSDGRNILVAWMRSWSEANLTKDDGWCGAMTLPRELTIKDNHIYQSPVREINNYLKNEKTISSITVNKNEVIELEEFAGNQSRITLEIDTKSLDETGKCGIEVFSGDNYKTVISYDANRNYVILDRTQCGSLNDGVRYAYVKPVNGVIKLDIFLDVNSVEVFINDGYYTMTATTYTPIDHKKVKIFAKGSNVVFKNLKKYDIIL